MQCIHRPHSHIMITQNLTRQTHLTQQLSFNQLVVLGYRHSIRLTANELNPTRRTSSITTTTMQDVKPVRLDCSHQPRVFRNLKRSMSFDLDPWHYGFSPSKSKMTTGKLQQLPSRYYLLLRFVHQERSHA